MHQATSGSAGTRSATTPGVITLVLTACVFGLIALGARLPSLGFEPASLALAASSRNDAALTETAATDVGSTPVERRSVRVVRNSATPDAEPPAATSAQFTFAPVDVAATVADHTATVSWHAAKAPDSARLSHYRVTSPAGRSCVATSATHTCALHDLADDVVYRFTVAAVWTTGESFPSRPANGVVTRVATPGAPTNVFLDPGTQPGTVTVTWTEPMSSGAAPIIGWSITSDDATEYRSRVATTTDSRGFKHVSCLLERSPNDPRPVRVAARNQFGYGAAAMAAPSQ